MMKRWHLAKLTLTFAQPGQAGLSTPRFTYRRRRVRSKTDIPEPTIRVVPSVGERIILSRPILHRQHRGAVLPLVVVRGRARKSKPSPRTRRRRSGTGGEAEARGVKAYAGRMAGRGHYAVDAHEAAPIQNARVWVERRTFDGSIASRQSAQTNADGRFGAARHRSAQATRRSTRGAPARASQALPPPPARSTCPPPAPARPASLAAWAKKKGPFFDQRAGRRPATSALDRRDDSLDGATMGRRQRKIGLGPGGTDALATARVSQRSGGEK